MGNLWRLILVLSVGFASAAVPALASAAETPDGVGPCSKVSDTLDQGDRKTVVTVLTGSCENNDVADDSGYLTFRLTTDGELDRTFGNGGVAPIVTTEYRRIVRAADGGLLVGSGYGLQKLDTNGHPDTAFGQDGQVSIEVSELIVAPDGRIAVISAGSTVHVPDPIALRVLNPDGSVDSSFGGGAVLPSLEFPGQPDHLTRWSGPITFSSEGGIFGAYYSREAGSLGEGIGVFKLDPNGDADTTFGGGDGIAPVGDSLGETGESQWNLMGINELTDGAVQINGQWTPSQGLNARPLPVLVEMGENGLSSSFKALERIGSYMTPEDFAISGTGTATMAVLLETFPKFTGHRTAGFSAGRFLRNGSPDPTFGFAGISSLRFNGYARSTTATLTPEGGVALSGTTERTSCADLPVRNGFCGQTILVARIDQAGDLDRSFGDCGLVSIPEETWDRTSDPDEFHCGDNPLPKPKPVSKDGRSLSGARALRITVKPSTTNQDRSRPWERSRLKFPKALRLRPGKLGRVGIYVRGPERIRTNGLSFDRTRRQISFNNPSVRSWQTARIVIPWNAFEGGRRAALGRPLRFKATYVADGAKSTAGITRLQPTR